MYLIIQVHPKCDTGVYGKGIKTIIIIMYTVHGP